jgi:hypothetical protein
LDFGRRSASGYAGQHEDGARAASRNEFTFFFLFDYKEIEQVPQWQVFHP